MLVLTARSLSKKFTNGTRSTTVLHGINLDIQAGEWVAIMGPSGCGKSTLLNVLGGLDTADEGDVMIDGTALRGLSESARARLRRKHVGYVFQQYNLLHGLTAAANVTLPCLLTGGSRRRAKRRSAELLERLGLSGIADMAPGELSGGEQQRVAIARALANSPTVLLADEPTGALDSESSRAVVDLLREEHERGQTIVIVTHDHRVAARADRVLMMRDGRISDERRLENSNGSGVNLSNLVSFEVL